MLVKRADTFQLAFESIFSQIKIRTLINTCKVVKHAKILVMRAALKLSYTIYRQNTLLERILIGRTPSMVIPLLANQELTPMMFCIAA